MFRFVFVLVLFAVLQRIRILRSICCRENQQTNEGEQSIGDVAYLVVLLTVTTSTSSHARWETIHSRLISCQVGKRRSAATWRLVIGVSYGSLVFAKLKECARLLSLLQRCHRNGSLRCRKGCHEYTSSTSQGQGSNGVAFNAEDWFYMALTRASAGDIATVASTRFKPDAPSDMMLATAVVGGDFDMFSRQATWPGAFVTTPALSR